MAKEVNRYSFQFSLISYYLIRRGALVTDSKGGSFRAVASVFRFRR
ncbi:hypothetical protein VDG1235_156 [Verrucomicrobiia bacterium DG1235]|nr:hypothetical protein VDG1235_156 [Verrucomicrobiae bacterium DG1235]